MVALELLIPADMPRFSFILILMPLHQRLQSLVLLAHGAISVQGRSGATEISISTCSSSQALLSD
jgi:hypothetical protein